MHMRRAHEVHDSFGVLATTCKPSLIIFDYVEIVFYMCIYIYYIIVYRLGNNVCLILLYF